MTYQKKKKTEIYLQVLKNFKNSNNRYNEAL